ncbi:MAG: glycosyltransferase [Luteitalea sp.]|nr:glycosyltransferase [Luteitalea sp.]
MLSDEPKVSLIVCTRNRGSRLLEFLTRLGQLESPPGGWELILVDNASTDSTPAILDEFARSATVPVHCVLAPVAGLSRARNVGIAESSGELLAFTDDDCYPARDYLRALVEIFEEHKPGFVGGLVVVHDPTDAPTLSSIRTPSEIRPRTFLAAGTMHGANMAISREVVRAIGGFDPHLGAGTTCVAGEDIEYLARAAWAGWSGRYDPRLVVAHHHGRKPGSDAIRQSRGYDYGRGAYYVKLILHPRARRTYLREWCRRAWWQLEAAMFGRPWRELVGGFRYLTSRLLRPEPVPRFDRAHMPSPGHPARQQG